MQTWSLGKIARWLFGIAFAVLFFGELKSTVNAPCDSLGAWISLASVVPAGLACIALLVRAIKERSAETVLVFIVGVGGAFMTLFVAFLWTMLLCRNI